MMMIICRHSMLSADHTHCTFAIMKSARLNKSQSAQLLVTDDRYRTVQIPYRA